MQDFFVEQNNDTTFDIKIEDNKFVTDDSFRTAFNFQLFVNKRADKTQISTPRDRGGWMGDLITKPDYQVGSYVYTKSQSRDTQADRNEVAEYSKLAMKYFLDYGALQVTATVEGLSIVGAIVVNSDEKQKYNSLWRNV